MTAHMTAPLANPKLKTFTTLPIDFLIGCIPSLLA